MDVLANETMLTKMLQNGLQELQMVRAERIDRMILELKRVFSLLALLFVRPLMLIGDEKIVSFYNLRCMLVVHRLHNRLAYIIGDNG